MLSFSR